MGLRLSDFDEPPSSFFRLPLELRQQIYRDYLAITKSQESQGISRICGSTSDSILPICVVALGPVNKQFRAELLDALIQRPEYCFCLSTEFADFDVLTRTRCRVLKKSLKFAEIPNLKVEIYPSKRYLWSGRESGDEFTLISRIDSFCRQLRHTNTVPCLSIHFVEGKCGRWIESSDLGTQLKYTTSLIWKLLHILRKVPISFIQLPESLTTWWARMDDENWMIDSHNRNWMVNSYQMLINKIERTQPGIQWQLENSRPQGTEGFVQSLQERQRQARDSARAQAQSQTNQTPSLHGNPSTTFSVEPSPFRYTPVQGIGSHISSVLRGHPPISADSTAQYGFHQRSLPNGNTPVRGIGGIGSQYINSAPRRHPPISAYPAAQYGFSNQSGVTVQSSSMVLPSGAGPVMSMPTNQPAQNTTSDQGLPPLPGFHQGGVTTRSSSMGLQYAAPPTSMSTHQTAQNNTSDQGAAITGQTSGPLAAFPALAFL